MNCLRAVVELRELALHVVEGGGELAELVVGVDAGSGRRSRRPATFARPRSRRLTRRDSARATR